MPWNWNNELALPVSSEKEDNMIILRDWQDWEDDYNEAENYVNPSVGWLYVIIPMVGIASAFISALAR